MLVPPPAVPAGPQPVQLPTLACCLLIYLISIYFANRYELLYHQSIHRSGIRPSAALHRLHTAYKPGFLRKQRKNLSFLTPERKGRYEILFFSISFFVLAMRRIARRYLSRWLCKQGCSFALGPHGVNQIFPAPSFGILSFVLVSHCIYKSQPTFPHFFIFYLLYTGMCIVRSFILGSFSHEDDIKCR